MLYPITETFYSIQGEGYHAGTPAFFIRFAGCNLRCPWCDTNHAKRREAYAKDLAGEASTYPSTLVILTGGEPTLHNLFPLVSALRAEGKYVAVETNGTLLTGGHIDLFDWLTVSPKPGWKYDLSALWGNEIKVVLDDVLDPHQFESCFFKHWFIQPCSGNFEPAIRFVKENPRWRLSIQVQKLIGIV
jgi:organic radical activating enzyme